MQTHCTPSRLLRLFHFIQKATRTVAEPEHFSGVVGVHEFLDMKCCIQTFSATFSWKKAKLDDFGGRGRGTCPCVPLRRSATERTPLILEFFLSLSSTKAKTSDRDFHEKGREIELGAMRAFALLKILRTMALIWSISYQGPLAIQGE